MEGVTKDSCWKNYQGEIDADRRAYKD